MRRTALILVCLASAACAGAPRQPAPAPAPDMAELEAIWRARTDSARLRFTAADVRFMADMIHHHAQALEMAALAPDRAAAQSIRILAARITSAQADEIGIMQQWLRSRGQPVPELHIAGNAVMVHGGHDHHHAAMPGMLSPEQLAELRAARGTTFDRLFLHYMIQHHRGAVVMVRDLFATDGAAQDEAVFRFASDVQVDQVTEIARMESMLAAMGGPPR